MESPLSPLAQQEKDHLESCAACSRFARRLQAARRFFREHHGNVEPDAAFAARVAARLNGGPAEMLGWAASRLLPATLALVLVLVWFAFRAEPVQQTAYEELAPTDDLLSWVLDRSEEEK
jgi:hypothetical protein